LPERPGALLVSLGLFDFAQGRLHYGLVERHLFRREGAVDFHLQLVGQILDDGGVGFEATQDERPGQPAQPRRGLGVLVAFDGQGEFVAEAALRAEQAGIEELHHRPQLQEPVLDRRAGERDAIARG